MLGETMRGQPINDERMGGVGGVRHTPYPVSIYRIVYMVRMRCVCDVYEVAHITTGLVVVRHIHHIT